MTLIDYYLLLNAIAAMALFGSLFVLTTIYYGQNAFVWITRSFVSFGLFLLHMDLLYRF